MPESGLPGATQTPPSYLRPPTMPRISRGIHTNGPFIFVLGIGMAALLATGYLALNQQGTAAKVTGIPGSIIFASKDGLVDHAIATNGEAPYPKFSPFDVESAAFSLNRKFLIEVGKDPKSGEKHITVANLQTKDLVSFAQLPASMIVGSPIVSNDGRYAAFVETSVVGKATISKIAVIDTAAPKPMASYVTYFGDPLSFSPDFKKLLVSAGTLLTVDIAQNTMSTVEGVPAKISGVFALAPDLHGAGYIGTGELVLGSMDWNRSSFIPQAHLALTEGQQGSKYFFFTDSIHLLLFNATTVYRYEVEGTTVSKLAESALQLPGGAIPKSWKP